MYVATGTHIYIYTTVISEPGDVTVCEGESTTFTCVLDKRGSGSNIHWYTAIMGGMTKPDDQLGSSFTATNSTINNVLTTNLTITNAMKSYTGQYWVGTSLFSGCYVFLTATTSMYVHTHPM